MIELPLLACCMETINWINAMAFYRTIHTRVQRERERDAPVKYVKQCILSELGEVTSLQAPKQDYESLKAKITEYIQK